MVILDSTESSTVDVTIKNMEDEPIWDHFWIHDRNVLRCMVLHTPCNLTSNSTLPVCVDSCVELADNIDTFESLVKKFCIKYFNPTETTECVRFGAGSTLTISFYLLGIVSFVFLLSN